MSLALQQCQPPGFQRKRKIRRKDEQDQQEAAGTCRVPQRMHPWCHSVPCPVHGLLELLQLTFFNPEPYGVPGRLLGGGRFVPLNDGGHLWAGVFFLLGLLGKGGMYSGDVDIHHITAKASTLCTMIWTFFNHRAKGLKRTGRSERYLCEFFQV